MNGRQAGFLFSRLLCLGTIIAAAGGLTVNGDETVSDSVTDLTWQQGEPGEMAWEEALVYAGRLDLAGHRDWRLPNIKELHSLNDDRLVDPSLDRGCFPGAFAASYWSSTSVVNQPAKAWVVDFRSGLVTYEGKTRRLHVRCVRGGKG